MLPGKIFCKEKKLTSQITNFLKQASFTINKRREEIGEICVPELMQMKIPSIT